MLSNLVIRLIPWVTSYVRHNIGMLSKAKGQILRIAATMHILFHLEKEEEVSEGIIEDAVLAAINYIQTCIQHTAYITGRSTVVEEVEIAEAGTFNMHKQSIKTST